MVKLFGEKREVLLDFFSSIIFEGPMASAIKAETIQTIGSVALTITPEGIVTCSMLDQVTRENIYLNIAFKASVLGEIEKTTEIAFLDASLVKGIISNYSSGDTVFLSLNDDETMITFSNTEETMMIDEPNIDAASIPGNDKGIIANIKWEGIEPEVGEGKKFNVKFGIHFPSLRVMEKMNKTLDTPHVSVKFSGKELYFTSGDYNDKRTNLFKASANSISNLQAGKGYVEGPVNATNKYPIGIIPLIKSLDDADGYARIVEDGRLEQLFFVGEKNGIKKVYMIGAAAKTDI